MPAPLVSAHATPEQERRQLAAQVFSRGQRIALLLLNYTALVHVSLVLATASFPWAAWTWRTAAALVLLYTLPPLLARGVLAVRPFSATTIAPGSADFLRWWTLMSLQTLFCRCPFLEECLRLVPGLYSAWLRLWGARLGRLIYWAPGVLVLDRSFLEIGDDVIFGAGVRLNPHVLAPDAQGRMQLLLAPVKIGAGALIGGYSLLTAGTEISSGESTRAFLISPPFSRWQNGRRVRTTASGVSPEPFDED